MAKGEPPITCLKLSQDNNYLVGYENKQPEEKLYFWYIPGKKEPQTEILDLDDNIDHTEDPSKLFVFGKESNVIYVRSDNKKGVKMIQLKDLVKIGETK